MKKIPLTQGQYALVDDDDYERVNAFKWYAHYSHRTKSYYATRKTPRPNQKHIYMHRFIIETPKGMLCDHINGDTLDNRKVNLRNCTNAQNLMNRKAPVNNTTGHKNIYFDKRKRLFVVAIDANKKRVFYKSFKHLERAIESRDNALEKHHGDFAHKD